MKLKALLRPVYVIRRTTSELARAGLGVKEPSMLNDDTDLMDFTEGTEQVQEHCRNVASTFPLQQITSLSPNFTCTAQTRTAANTTAKTDYYLLESASSILFVVRVNEVQRETDPAYRGIRRIVQSLPSDDTAYSNLSLVNRSEYRRRPECHSPRPSPSS